MNKSNSRSGIWALFVDLMRRDSGITEAEARARMSDHTGGDRSATIAANLGSLCGLCGGRKAGDGMFTLSSRKDRLRGRIYILTGQRVASRKGVLGDMALLLSRPQGASRGEVIVYLVDRFQDHTEKALRATAYTHLSIWASILPKRAAQATFTMTADVNGKPIFRVH